MRVMVACEESQAVCKAFRARGHEAYSCDIIECSGGHPEWHIQQDVIPLLNGRCRFQTVDGLEHEICGRWDLIIAHPPCTYLTLSGNGWYNIDKYGEKAVQRIKARAEAMLFFNWFVVCDCDHIAIENPIGIMNTAYRKPNQIIHPWQFGDSVNKSTCLWLRGLPNLVPETNEKPEIEYHESIGRDGRIRRQEKWYYETRCLPHKDRARAASKTFPGIARAMAERWG